MSATGSGNLKVREFGHRRHRSNSDPQATAEALAQLRLEDGKSGMTYHFAQHAGKIRAR
ncbi:unnamed protein product, partial [Ixodes hexagonus]